MSLKEQILNRIKQAKLEAGKSADIVEAEIKEAEAILTKDNEAENTENVGKGKELAKDQTLNKVIDMAIEYSSLLKYLPGFHGTGLATSERLPVIGEIGLFKGNSELKNSSEVNATPGLTTNLLTGEVEIKQGMFKHEILISYRLLNNSVIDLYNRYMDEIAKSMAKTIDAYIINADANLEGNINSDGTTFTEADRENYYFLQGDNGLRKLAIANAISIGTLDTKDYLDVSEKLGAFANKTEDILILQTRKTQNRLIVLPEFKDASVNGVKSTVRDQAVSSVWGFDIFLNEFIPNGAKADGKVSATAEDNTYGQFVEFYTPAVQYGFGQELRLDTQIIPGKGIMLVPYFEFGFAIVNGEAETDNTVAGGVEITY